jgi:hypothetical protein
MSWGVALRNAVGLGLGGIPSLLNAPPYAKLAFNFLSGEFDPRITFSRTSNATLIGSNGTLQYAPHNLLTYSEQFDNAAWGKTNASVTSNSIAAPDGTTTGDTVIRSTGVAAFIGNSSGAGAARQYTMSLYAKAATAGNGVGLRIQGTFPNRGDVVFNLTNGTISSPAVAAGTATGASATIASAGGGWYRCTLTVTLADSLTICVFSPCETTAPAASFEAASAVASDCHSWGAQLNVDALQPYYSTTVKNLQGYSQEFDDAAWLKSNSTVTANVTAAPDGSLTADKLSEDTATIGHYLGPATTIVGVLGQVSTFSCYAKAAERTFLQLIFTGVAPGSGNYIAGFDLSAGSAGTPSSGATSSIVNLGNGWFRCSMTATVQTAANIGRQIRISQNSSSTPSSYTGDGTSGIYIWGAQFSDSASLDPYVYNPAAAPSNTAYYGPRFDYDPVTLAAKGLLIEEQRTNLALNSGDALSGGTGGVVVANQITAPDGSLADFFREDTSNGEHYAGDRTATVTAGTLYTWAFYAKLGLTGGARRVCVRTGLQGPANVIFDLETGSSTVLAPVVSSGISSAGNGWWRCWIVYTPTGTGTALFRQQLANGVSTVYTGDGTSGLFFWGAQLEVGAFPTSYIPTTTAAATRAADVLSVTGANFSNWYNPVEGTMFAEFGPYANGGASKNFGIAHIDDGTSNNMIRLFAGSTVSPVFAVTASTVTQAYLSTGALAPTSVSKIAGAYKADDFARSFNGTVAATDLLGTVPAANRLLIGSGFVGVNELNGHIRSFKYYPTRLSNGQLQTLTK